VCGSFETTGSERSEKRGTRGEIRNSGASFRVLRYFRVFRVLPVVLKGPMQKNEDEKTMSKDKNKSAAKKNGNGKTGRTR
jgi:hypothetical protein